jgi:hypothetical protein
VDPRTLQLLSATELQGFIASLKDMNARQIHKKKIDLTAEHKDLSIK